MILIHIIQDYLINDSTKAKSKNIRPVSKYAVILESQKKRKTKRKRRKRKLKMKKRRKLKLKRKRKKGGRLRPKSNTRKS